jgi:hypothetical protein
LYYYCQDSRHKKLYPYPARHNWTRFGVKVEERRAKERGKKVAGRKSIVTTAIDRIASLLRRTSIATIFESSAIALMTRLSERVASVILSDASAISMLVELSR